MRVARVLALSGLLAVSIAAAQPPAPSQALTCGLLRARGHTAFAIRANSYIRSCRYAHGVIARWFRRRLTRRGFPYRRAAWACFFVGRSRVRAECAAHNGDLRLSVK